MYLNVWLMEEDMPYGGLPFSGTGCPAPNAGFNCFVDSNQILEMVGTL